MYTEEMAKIATNVNQKLIKLFKEAGQLFIAQNAKRINKILFLNTKHHLNQKRHTKISSMPFS